MPYRLPPFPIPEIIDAPPTPALSVSPDRETMALLGRANLPGIAELAEPELRLAGVRINPRTNGPSRAGSFNSLTFRALHGGAERPVELPPEARINYPRWSPYSSALAFIRTTADGIELWVAEAGSGEARRVGLCRSLPPGRPVILGRNRRVTEELGAS